MKALAVAVAVVALAGCTEGGNAEHPAETNDSINVSVEPTPHGTYICFTYTTVHRGGIWCDRISR